MLAPVEEIFCDIDDFCKHFLKKQSAHILPNPLRQRDRESQMSLSEIATIIVLFQMSHYRTFKDYYEQCILQSMKNYFPTALSYTRFVSIKQSALCVLAAYLVSKSGKHTGLYYIDSTTLRVCHNKRINKHKVFKNIAAICYRRFSLPHSLKTKKPPKGGCFIWRRERDSNPRWSLTPILP